MLCFCLEDALPFGEVGLVVGRLLGGQQALRQACADSTFRLHSWECSAPSPAPAGDY